VELGVWEWFAVVGIGGDRCVDRELQQWVDAAPLTVELRQDLHDYLVSSLMEQFEQGSGRSANPEAVEVAREYWAPHVEPVVAEEWSRLRDPSVDWFAERVGCRRAWRLQRGGVELDAPMIANYRRFWSEGLEARQAEIRESVWRLWDAHGAEFEAQVLAVLPGPPIRDVPWE
jgi:hypothetical protein